MKDGYMDFDEYIRQGEPDKSEKSTLWLTPYKYPTSTPQAPDRYPTSRRQVPDKYRTSCARSLCKS